MSEINADIYRPLSKEFLRGVDSAIDILEKQADQIEDVDDQAACSIAKNYLAEVLLELYRLKIAEDIVE